MNEEEVYLKLYYSMFGLQVFLLLFSLSGCHASQPNYLRGSIVVDRRADDFLPQVSPSASPQPFLPLLAPSPLSPFISGSIPKLSGLCVLNFTGADSLISTTAIDCWNIFASLLGNVMCCPQLEATLAILIGQSSRETNVLALNGNASKHCLSDIEQILVGQGASEELRKICSLHPVNLTEGTCPVKDVREFESVVDTSKLIAACEKIDPVKECCDQVCQNAILDAASGISLRASKISSVDGPHGLPNPSARINDCKNIVLRWLASKLDHSSARTVLRGLSNCKVNKVCPLVFPDMRHVAKGCANEISNQSVCCSAMENYVSHLQKQSLVTNLQALDCATTLGAKLQKFNITRDLYGLCHISLKDFSLQVAKQEYGCLLPSLPSDATFDKSAGISFICDLNDNIPAPWPSSSQLLASSCNKTIRMPALPAAASVQNDLYDERVKFYVLLAASLVFMVVL